MQKRHTPRLLIVISVLALAVFLFAWNRRSDVPPTNTETNGSVLGDSDEQVPPTDPITKENQKESDIHPVSLLALSETTFDGRDLHLGDVLDDNAAYTRYHITYKSEDLTISGILNVPKGEGPFPVLVLNHGYIDRDVYTNGRGLRREQEYLARRGFAVLHTDYRCHAQSECRNENDVSLRLGYITDAINAVEAVKQSGHPKLDAGRIGMLGHSMGGGVTLGVLVAQPDLLDAAVLFAPVSSDIRDSIKRWTARRPEEMQRVIEAYGSLDENPGFWENLSPRTFFDRVQAPVTIHHGTADADVPLEWSEATAAALRSVSKDVTLDVYPGQPHEFTSAWGLVMERTAAFFRAHLGS